MPCVPIIAAPPVGHARGAADFATLRWYPVRMSAEKTVSLPTEVFALSATASVAGLLLWMATFLIGPLMLIPAALAWLFWLFFFRRHAKGRLAAIVEYFLETALLGAQVCLIIAILMRVGPTLL